MQSLLLDTEHENFLDSRSQRKIVPGYLDIGWIVGQVHDTRIHVLSLIPAPIDNKAFTPTSFPSLLTHAHSLHTSCIGAMTLLGIYMIGTTELIKSHEDRIIRELVANLPIKAGSSSDHFLLKYTLQRKLTCDVIAERYRTRPEDAIKGKAITVKVQSKIVIPTNYRCLYATVKIDETFVFNPSTGSYDSQLDSALAPFQDSIQHAMYTIDDDRHDGTTLMERLGGGGTAPKQQGKKSKGKSNKSSSSNTNECSQHRVALYRRSTKIGDDVKISPAPIVVRIVGIMDLMALVHIKRTIDEGVKFLKSDLLSTIHARLTPILTSSFTQSSHIITLPRRIFINIGMTCESKSMWIPYTYHQIQGEDEKVR